MRRVTAKLVTGLLAAVLSLLAEQCWADGGGPSLAERVIWAVNAGGEAHVDVHGIQYKKDPLEGKLGKGELIWLVFCYYEFMCVDSSARSCEMEGEISSVEKIIFAAEILVGL